MSAVEYRTNGVKCLLHVSTGESRSAAFYAAAQTMGAMRLDGETAVWSDVSMEWLER